MVIQLEHRIVRVPNRLPSLTSFRRWARSEEFPQHGQYAFLNGDLWIDPTAEHEGHNQVRTQITTVLANWVRDSGAGLFYSDRMALVNSEADLSTEPDGMFLSYASLKDRRARLARRANSPEVVGSPDMVLEVVSPNSAEKDADLLRDLYWQAGIAEYWLVDPRRNSLIFDILRHGPRGYAAARKLRGWIKSPVFGKSFRLSHRKDRLGSARFRLHVR